MDSQFPASAFSFEKISSKQEETLPSRDTITKNNNLDRLLEEAGSVLSHLPCRALEDWYLVAKPNRALLGYFVSDETFAFPFRRVSLPVDTQDLQNYVLVGTLKPQQPQREGVKVELEELDFYTIDNEKGYRGYWVITAKAKYWLQNPCSKVITIPRIKVRLGGKYSEADDDSADEFDGYGSGTLSAQLPSQDQLHYFHRAQLGLLSNLKDMLILPDGSYNSFFHNLSAAQMDDVLTPSSKDLSDFHGERKKECGANDVPTLFKHSFDLDLLQSSNFLLPHICAISPQVATSRWYKELRGSNALELSVGYLQSPLSESFWIQSAIKSEARSRQLPSGENDPNQSERCIDLLYPIELELQYYNSMRRETLSKGNNDAFDDDQLPKEPLPPLPRDGQMNMQAPQTPSSGLNSGTEESSKVDTPMREGEPDKISIQSADIGRRPMLDPSEILINAPAVAKVIKFLSIIPSKEMIATAPSVANAIELFSTLSQKRGLPKTIELKKSASPNTQRKRFKAIVKEVQMSRRSHPDCPVDLRRIESSVVELQAVESKRRPSAIATKGIDIERIDKRTHTDPEAVVMSLDWGARQPQGQDADERPRPVIDTPTKNFPEKDRDMSPVNFVSPCEYSHNSQGPVLVGEEQGLRQQHSVGEAAMDDAWLV